ncbi:transmembrane protein C1orf162 homolog isoform X2 [Castor canadensis]|uniref:Transmembrane protein C1orf162 homolog isoform X2 n=1 Tax=Castor canadensis TaxID=51338 RepID=A0AC58KPN8_CASCN
MGGSHSASTTKIDTPTVAPTTSSLSCLSNYPTLILAFFAGVLLTLLLMAFVFLIIKSCRRCHPSPQVLDPHSDSPAKKHFSSVYMF